MDFTLPSFQISAKDGAAIINLLDNTFVKPIENAFSTSKSEQSGEPKDIQEGKANGDSELSPNTDINPFFTFKQTKKGRGLFRGTDGDEKIVTNNRDNAIIGGKGKDTIKAGGGHDVVFGGDDNDLLNGGVGNDTINGGAGNDTLIGGSGADTFFINKGMNIIEDFNKDEGDTLKFGVLLSDIRYEQDGDDVLIHSDKGITVILNNNVNDFI